MDKQPIDLQKPLRDLNFYLRDKAWSPNDMGGSVLRSLRKALLVGMAHKLRMEIER